MPIYKGTEIVNYYAKDYEMFVDKKLSLKPYGQCGVRFGDDSIKLYSYTSLVLELFDNKIVLYMNPAYSRTTIYHIGAFLKEYKPSISYYDLKEAWKNKDGILKF